MIELKNIKINDAIAVCDIYPEDSTVKGRIRINLEKETLEEYSLPKGYEHCKNHIYKAMNYLIKHARDIQITPINKKTLIWY